MRELIPHGRNIVDSRRVVVYFRPSPDGERIIFGGRAALSEKDPLACAARLRSMLTRIFPQLRAARIDHAWVGWVAYTFDTMPHLGRRDGIYYCMGYCGQGVPLAPYFGMKIGRQMAGLAARSHGIGWAGLPDAHLLPRDAMVSRAVRVGLSNDGSRWTLRQSLMHRGARWGNTPRLRNSRARRWPASTTV